MGSLIYPSRQPCVGHNVRSGFGVQELSSGGDTCPGLHPWCTAAPGGLASAFTEPSAGPTMAAATSLPPDCSLPLLGWSIDAPFLLPFLPFAHLPAQVVKVKPHDKDAKMKYQECNKVVKQKAFERAIAGDEHKRSVVDSLDIESMSESGRVPCRAQPRTVHSLAWAAPFFVHTVGW